MKIDLQSIDKEQFMVHEHIVNGEVCYLVQPQHIGCQWSAENKIFRSSLWNFDGELISAGFPKFVNWGEKPEVFPLPETLDGATIVEKIDGSLLIVSKYKGEYILRTRGTSDATQLDNGHELEIFKKTILSVLAETNLQINSTVVNFSDETWGVSWLFEWTSPNQKIVLNYGDEPKWYLVGIVEHDDYSLVHQDFLNVFAKALSLNRPATYTFTIIEDLLANVDQWKGKEGVCVYSNNGKSIHKVKCSEYLIKHRFKSEANLENTLNLFFECGQPIYQEFEQRLIQQFDYECFVMVRGFASAICDASKHIIKVINGIMNFVEPLKSLPRKDAAQAIISSYGSTGRSNMAFTMLDGKSLSVDQLKKLYWQILKK